MCKNFSKTIGAIEIDSLDKRGLRKIFIRQDNRGETTFFGGFSNIDDARDGSKIAA